MAQWLYAGAAALRRSVSTVAEEAYRALIGRWLWKLYRHGPMVTPTIGFWAGLSDVDMCARMANSAASDWAIGGEAGRVAVAAPRCTQMIARAFSAFEVSVQVLLYAAFLWWLLCALWECGRTWTLSRALAGRVARHVDTHLALERHAVTTANLSAPPACHGATCATCAARAMLHCTRRQRHTAAAAPRGAALGTPLLLSPPSPSPSSSSSLSTFLPPKKKPVRRRVTRSAAARRTSRRTKAEACTTASSSASEETGSQGQPQPRARSASRRC